MTPYDLLRGSRSIACGDISPSDMMSALPIHSSRRSYHLTTSVFRNLRNQRHDKDKRKPDRETQSRPTQSCRNKGRRTRRIDVQGVRIEAGTEARGEGRSEIPASSGGGEKIGVVAGRSQSDGGAETADPIWTQRD